MNYKKAYEEIKKVVDGYFSEDAEDDGMSASFFMSNMSPQDPSFNRGIWKKLEEQVRSWAVENREIYVVTGPVLTDGPYQYIGVNKVAIPKHYYKVVLDYLEPELKAIGFILPNKKGTYPLSQYAVTVDEVERITDIDFFYILSDDVEEMLESELDLSLWSLNGNCSISCGNLTVVRKT